MTRNHTDALTQHRSRYALAALILTVAACHPHRVRTRPYAPGAVARSTSTPTPQQLAASPRPLPSPVFQEQDIGEGSEAAPQSAPRAGDSTPPQLAALPPHAPEAAPASLVPAESESLLGLIGPKTAPNTVASLRLIEDGRQQMNQ